MTRSSFVPGFRFHPTDVELVMYYLKRKLSRKKMLVNAVAEVNIYDFSPWDLPDKSLLRNGDLEWFFFCPKARKYAIGSRSNRATESGFWKATGKERQVKYNERIVAIIKTLVFHLGSAPKGQRTDWVMHEYCMKDEHLANQGILLDTYVLCKIYQKNGVGPQNGAQYGAPFNEEAWEDDDDDDGYGASCSASLATMGPDGTLNHKPTMKMAEPGSSTVTVSANVTNKAMVDYKQKGPVMMETSVTEPGSSMVTFCANGTRNTSEYNKQQTESKVAICENEKGVDDSDDVLYLEDFASILEESPNDDVLFLEDIAPNMEEFNKNEVVEVGKEKGNEESVIYENLGDFVNLEDVGEAAASGLFGTEYFPLDTSFTADDLRGFYVD